jgi:hypothetical protein
MIDHPSIRQSIQSVNHVSRSRMIASNSRACASHAPWSSASIPVPPQTQPVGVTHTRTGRTTNVRHCFVFVIPADAGIQCLTRTLRNLDPGSRIRSGTGSAPGQRLSGAGLVTTYRRIIKDATQSWFGPTAVRPSGRRDLLGM